jgi:hypothetical protein
VAAPVVEPEVIEDVVVAEEPVQIVDEVSSVEEEILAEVEVEAVALEETPVIEAAVVAEPTFKNETNAYKKKKNKY